MKRLIVCCDGTWQKLKSPYPTNVVKIAQGIRPSCIQDGKTISQIVFYDEGVGTDIVDDNSLFSWVNTVLRVIGGAFGSGIDHNIQQAYRFLSLNYEDGDEIYLFGFSRGAFTVRSLAGLINCSGGLVSLPHIRDIPWIYNLYKDTKLTLEEKKKFLTLSLPIKWTANYTEQIKCREEILNIYRDRKNFSFEDIEKDISKAQEDLEQKEGKAEKIRQDYGFGMSDNKQIRPAKITLLGCWDTVGSLGLPPGIPVLSDWANKNVKFHDTTLSPIIKHALHAVSIDEKRKVFNVTLMKKEDPNSEEQTLSEVWFPGTHGSVGGGEFKEKNLSNAALGWMVNEIKRLSLELDIDLKNSEDSLSAIKNKEDKWIYDPAECEFNPDPGWFGFLGLKEREIPPNQSTKIHESVETRLNADNLNPRYNPTNLVEYKNKLEGINSSFSFSTTDAEKEII